MIIFENICLELGVTPTIFLSLFMLAVLVQALLIKWAVSSDKEIRHLPNVVNIVAIIAMYINHSAMPIVMGITIVNVAFVLWLVGCATIQEIMH